MRPGEEQTEQKYTFEVSTNTSEKELGVREKNDGWGGELSSFGKDAAAINNEGYDESSTARDVQGLSASHATI